MATARQIGAKARELDSATDALQEMVIRRSNLVQQASELQARIATQQSAVQTLRAELVVLVNEP